MAELEDCFGVLPVSQRPSIYPLFVAQQAGFSSPALEARMPLVFFPYVLLFRDIHTPALRTAQFPDTALLPHLFPTVYHAEATDRTENIVRLRPTGGPETIANTKGQKEFKYEHSKKLCRRNPVQINTSTKFC